MAVFLQIDRGLRSTSNASPSLCYREINPQPGTTEEGHYLVLLYMIAYAPGLLPQVLTLEEEEAPLDDPLPPDMCSLTVEERENGRQEGKGFREIVNREQI